MTISEAFQIAIQHHQAGRLAEAEPLYRQILAVQPQHADALHLLGVIAQQVGRNDVAVDLIRQAIGLTPGNAAMHSNLGAALRGSGKLDEAVVAYRRALELQPDYADAHNNLGNALRYQGQLDEAIAAYRRALALKPDYAEAHNNLGIAMWDKGRFDDAIAAYRRVIELKPDDVEAHGNLGNALKDHGLLSEAIAAYRRALQLKPDFAAAHASLGNALRGNDRLDEAVAALRRAVELQPDLAISHNYLGNALKDRGQLEEAVESCRRAVALKPDDAALHSNLILISLYQQRHDDAAIREECQRWQQRHAAPLEKSALPHPNKTDPERRLKIGYVSPHFHICAVPHFVVPLLEAHDHAGFEIHCYASVRRPDPMTERLKKSADVWRDVFGMSDEALTEQIRADGIDILLDLAMHSGNNRLLVFARKPAPVQVSWLGHPGTTGLRAMDYRLTDACMDPEGAAWSVSPEDPVRLPDSWFCYDPLDPVPGPGELPALKAGGITFGCVNNFCKVNEAVLKRWAGVLSAVENSRLLLRCPAGESCERVLGFFQSQGIAARRVEFAPALLARSEYLRLFDRMDIALDPFPYNGGTTTAEALWMGVPVLTLPGEMAMARLGLSILSACGMPEFVAHTEEEYVRLAANLATDLPRLSELRSTLRGRMKASAFMDGPRFAKNVEHAFRAMWRAWCAKQNPAQAS